MNKREENFATHIGEKYLTNYNCWVTIINYDGYNNCTIQFEDGIIMEKVQYGNLKRGAIRKPICRVGLKFDALNEEVVEIVEYFGVKNCTIKYTDGTIIKNVQFYSIVNKQVKNPNSRSVEGVGYLGVGKYKTKNSEGKLYKNYGAWRGMFSRCYNKKGLKLHPTYKDVTVCEEWHNYQNFAKWHEENWKAYMDSSWNLDKDILVKGNKIYSPENCCFIPQKLNKLFTKCDKARGNLPIGVRYYKSTNKYVTYICIEGKAKNLGYFDTSEEAFQVYKTAKEAHIKEVADKWRGQITEECYQAMYRYEVEITD